MRHGSVYTGLDRVRHPERGRLPVACRQAGAVTYQILLAMGLIALGLALVTRRFPPHWMHGAALPRDPLVWREVHVRLGWCVSVVGVGLLIRALVA